MRVDRHPLGLRCYVGNGRRLHHGLVGAVLTLAGVLLTYHDRRDWPWPFIDRP